MWKLIKLKLLPDDRGLLTVCEYPRELPFAVKRVYCITKVPEGGCRGGHAHKNLRQLIYVLSGSLDILLSNGYNEEVLRLTPNGVAVEIMGCVWRELSNFTGDCVCIVLASDVYDEHDYIRDFNSFEKFSKNRE